MIPPDDDPEPYASPACLLHEMDPAWTGLAPDGEGSERARIMLWRRRTRERLIAARRAMPAAQRALLTEGIVAGLDALLDDVAGRTVSAYWPFGGEPDLRPWLATVIARGGICALPVVVQRAAPLEFRAWGPGDRLERGVWNIPYPADGAPVLPDIVIAPLVGFDPAGFRLGHGGGYFDRTLAALSSKPCVVGVGYAMAALATIHPLPHDVPMDAIVTEAGIAHRRNA